MPIHIHTDTHTHTHKNTHTNKHTHTNTHKQTYKLVNNTHKKEYRQINTQKHTHSCTCIKLYKASYIHWKAQQTQRDKIRCTKQQKYKIRNKETYHQKKKQKDTIINLSAKKFNKCHYKNDTENTYYVFEHTLTSRINENIFTSTNRFIHA